MKGSVHQEGTAILTVSAPKKSGLTSVGQKSTGQKQSQSRV